MIRLVRLFFLPSLAMVLTLTDSATGQDPSPELRQGFHALRRIIFSVLQEQPQPLTTLEQLAEEPSNTLLVVLGKPTMLQDLELHEFVRSGGAALIASDHEVPAHLLGREFNVRISSERVRLVAGNPRHAYRGLDDCPVIRPTQAQSLPMFLSLPRGLATNRPGHVLRSSRSSKGLAPLALFPGGCGIGSQQRVWLVPTIQFAVGGAWGAGRILVLSDHSVFINDMLLQPDNDNFDFAVNAITWLSDNGERRRVLFVEEGVVQTEFNIPLQETPMPVPPPSAVLAAINKALSGLEEENAFNRALVNLTGPIDTRTVARLVILVSTAGLGLYGMFRLQRSWYRPEPGTDLLSVILPRLRPTATLAEQRRQAVVHSDNFWEPARALVRQTFDALPGWRRGAELPPLRLHGNWWRRWYVARRLRYLWQLAYGPRPVSVSARQFHRLPEELKWLQAQVAAGLILPDEGPFASGRGNHAGLEDTHDSADRIPQ